MRNSEEKGLPESEEEEVRNTTYLEIFDHYRSAYKKGQGQSTCLEKGSNKGRKV